MSAVSTAPAPLAGGLGALPGATSDGTGLGSTGGKAPSSFGAALASAERMLAAGVDAGAGADIDADVDVDVENTMPAEASVGAPSDRAVPEDRSDAPLPIEASLHGKTDPEESVPDAGQPAIVVAALVAIPVAPVIESAPTAPERMITDGSAPDRAVTAGARSSTPPDSIGAPLAAGTAAVPAQAAGSGVPTTPDRPVVAASVVAAPVAAALVGAAPATTRAASLSTDASAARPDAAVLSSSTSATTPAAPFSPLSAPAVSAPDSAAAPLPRTVAAQVVPAVLSIVQRPVGSHQLTMTVTPDTLGPVTVRAHISPGGEVRVELVGASDAAREALRSLVSDLRRDLAAVMPHASLSLGTGATGAHSTTAGPADAGGLDRGPNPGGGGATNGQASGERAPGHGSGDSRVRADDGTGRVIPPFLPTTTHAASGEGLDIFA